MQRRHLFAGVPEVWELIQEHQARCDCATVARLLADLGSGKEEAGDSLFEALHFDHYLRQLLIDDWELTPAATELLLGRPLSDFLETYGIHATLTPEGVFRLESSRNPRTRTLGGDWRAEKALGLCPDAWRSPVATLTRKQL